MVLEAHTAQLLLLSYRQEYFFPISSQGKTVHPLFATVFFFPDQSVHGFRASKPANPRF